MTRVRNRYIIIILYIMMCCHCKVRVAMCRAIFVSEYLWVWAQRVLFHDTACILS